MKIFENKSVFKKLMIVLICILVLGFLMPNITQAGGDDGPGGKLLKPVVDLFLGIGDGALNIIHNVIFDQSEATITVDMTTKWWEIFSTIMLAIVVTVVVAAAIVLTSGAIVAAAGAIGVTLSTVSVGTVLLVSIGTGVGAAAVYNSNSLPDDLQLPVYRISPQEIFSNEIALFDVDFFNPMDESEKVTKVTGSKESSVASTSFNSTDNNYSIDSVVNKLLSDNGISKTYSDIENGLYSNEREDETGVYKLIQETTFTEGNNQYKIKAAQLNTSDSVIVSLYKIEEVTSTETVYKSTAYKLRSTISNWYNILRNISLVALLSVLVYIGIRILISSTSSDKAKYKQMLIDWIIAICLLFSMHYIMAFSNFIVEKITDVLSSVKYDEGYFAIIADADGKIKDALTEGGAYKEDMGFTEAGVNYIKWKTNLLGIARLNAQMNTDATATYAGYVTIFLLIVLFTIYFIFTYLRRVLYMAFLTLIAPLVALTYPIDKINDGKAQAFDMWLKEYIFNLLIQPMHLLLYTILVSSAFELASQNMIYSIVAIAFMIPAEKLLRKFFGFEKAQTPGLLAGPAGAALTMTGLNNLMKHRPPKHDGGGKSGGNTNSLDNESKPRFSFDKEEGMIGNGNDFAGKDSMLAEKNNLNKDSMEKVKTTEGSNSKVEQDESMWEAFYNNMDNGDNKLKNSLDSQNPSTQANNANKINSAAQNNKKEPTTKSITANTFQNPKRSIRRGLQATGRKYTRGVRDKIGNSISNLHPLKTASKVALGAAGAATFGAAAGIVGLATGDPSKAFQYASTGLVGGYKLGGSVADTAQSALDVPMDISDEFKRGYYGSDDEYNKAKQKEYINKMKRDTKNMEKLEYEFGIEEAKYIKNNVIEDYAKDGITDIDDIITGYKVEKEEGMDRGQVKSGIKYSNRIGQDTSKMKKDDLDKWQKTFTNEFSRNKRVKEEKLDAEELGNKTMNTIRIVDKYKYK